MGKLTDISIDEQELAEAIMLWFARHGKDVNKRRGRVWKVLKWNLGQSGNWKNAARGNPRAGYTAMKEKGES